jgi:hypothetical protein
LRVDPIDCAGSAVAPAKLQIATNKNAKLVNIWQLPTKMALAALKIFRYVVENNGFAERQNIFLLAFGQRTQINLK